MATTKRTSRKTSATKRPAKRTATAKRTAAKAVKRASKAPAVKRARKSATKQTNRAVRATKKTAKTARRATASVRPAQRTSSRSNSSVDAIALLKQDHKEVAQLFTRFEKAGDTAYKARGRLVASMIEALSRHAAIEEQVFYPAVRRELPRAESDVLEALEEHHVVKWLLRELESLDPKAERFDAKVTVLMESVRHHVREEERDLFPKVRAKMGRQRLSELGAELRAAKEAAPTRPHPMSPDEPPGNVLVGEVAAVIDRARAAGKRAVERVREELPT